MDMSARAFHKNTSQFADIVEPDADTIRVVLADDRELLRDSLRRVFAGQADLEVVAEAPDMPTVVRRVHGLLSQVLVLDVTMPGEASIAMLRRLRRQVPETSIVVRSASEDPIFARRVLAAGAMAVVANGAADELAQAVRRAARNERYVSPSIDGDLTSRQEEVSSAARLTARELEVLRLIALGYTSVEVAGKFDLSPRTIETHRARIHRKLKVASRAGLVSYALAHGLVRNGVAAQGA
jgi:two-component system, NarL family, response regulator NreC